MAVAVIVGCELTYEPSVGDGVIDSDRVALVVGFAKPAEADPQRVDSRRAVKNAALPVEDCKAGIDSLYIVIRAYISVGVRRVGTATYSPEVRNWRGHGLWGQQTEPVLDDRVCNGPLAAWVGCPLHFVLRA